MMTRLALPTVSLLTFVAACGGGSGGAGPGDASHDALVAAVDAGDGRVETADSATSAPDAATADTGPAAQQDAGMPSCADQGSPPYTLDCTGLYSDIATKALAPGVHPYQPAVPLWSDGAQKARWIQLPPGTKIDATNPNEWKFPIGTKVWKEFSKGGKRVETRFFQKVDDGPPPIWVHAAYAWNDDESAAKRSAGGDISFGGGTYHIPTFAECDKCHNGRTDHVLGFEQISLGLDGAQGLTLAELVNEGLIAPAPAQTRLTLGDDGTGVAAPALGWLHINCGVTCHNANSTSTGYGLGMRLRLDTALLDGRPLTRSDDPLKTTIGVAAKSPGWVQPKQWTRIIAGDPDNSLLVQLISYRGMNNAAKGQMPPIASSVVDTDDVAKVVDWVRKLTNAPAVDAGADAQMLDEMAPDGGLDATVVVDAAADAPVE